MSDEVIDSFQRRVLGLPLRLWLTFIVAFVVGFVITAVLWTIVAGRDVQTILTFLQTALTFLTLVAALVALRYAAESARAARDTVRPLQTMATDLATTAETMKANLELAERGRREDRVIHLLTRFQRVYKAVMALQRLVDSRESHKDVRDGQATLKAALASLPSDELPECHRLVDSPLGMGAVPQSGVTNARLEVERALDHAHRSLDDLLASAPGNNAARTGP